MVTGDIYTVAGGGTGGLGDGGPATSAELNLPRAVTVDRTGDLLIARREQQSRAAGGCVHVLERLPV
jgi:hypothetical protein